MVQIPRHLVRCALVGLLLVACGDDKPKDAPAPLPPAEAPKPAAEAPKPAASPAIAEADAKAFVERWVALQNAGDFAGYGTLYDRHFRGVKRSGPRVRNYDQKGWLADRAGMFKKPMQVKAEDLTVSTTSGMAVATFTQDWASGSYHDRGPKRMVLVKTDAGGLAISSEELLSSDLAAEAQAAGTEARMIVNAGKGPSYVLVAKTKLVPGAGLPLFVEVGSPSIAAFALPEGAQVPELAPFLAGPVHVIGSKGSCDAKPVAARLVSVAYEHFGVVQRWRGQGEEPKATDQDIAKALFEEPHQAFVAVELDAACTEVPTLALPGSEPQKTPIAARFPEPAWQVKAKTAFGKLPWTQKLTQEERDELLQVAAYGGFGKDTLEYIAVGAVTSCGVGVQGFALYRIQGDELELVLESDKTELVWAQALVDLDDDGKPEIVGTGSFGAPTLITDLKGKVLRKLEIPYFDCPC